ncbi:hypothetical protein LEP1GSC059_0759 [Leptospira noguchii serovar Panama str. CZ214]|uniref:Uncharacterized protein n=1 Tax=Leptospira noguchii serovar Panama str. CZ214 TaxID=1001595 RepID=T0FGM3_9LEPT|nr:hypothetical protein LEP1GSC059_0759 [Leptospira noguchii serovar Panama str. CZ214]
MIAPFSKTIEYKNPPNNLVFHSAREAIIVRTKLENICSVTKFQ